MPTDAAENTFRFRLPYIMPSQAQKHVTHNEALAGLDALMHLSAADRDLASPPAGAPEGRCYIVGPSPSGAWAGHEGKLAIAEGVDWRFVMPSAGLLAYVEDESSFVYHDGADWKLIDETMSDLQVATLAVNAAADPASRLIVGADTVAFTHDDSTPGSGDIRLKLNKSTAAGTASFLFQTEWSGRAEMGTTGSDEFQLKTSADGSIWKTALKADSAGTVTVPEKLCVGSNVAGTGNMTVATGTPVITLRDTDSTGNQHVGFFNWVDGAAVQRAYMGLAATSNSEFTFLSSYADGFAFYTSGGSYPIQFLQNGVCRLKIHTNSNIGVHETAPTAPLHVAGAVRIGAYAVAALPSASALGAGAIVFVSNETGGATLAFSDGANWRRCQDRAVVS